MSTGTAPSPDDEEFLDRLLSRFLADLAEGRDVDPATAVAERPHLLSEARALLLTARAASTRRPAGPPALPEYEILGVAGAGAMGRIYTARRRGTDERVAVKILLAGAVSAAAAERFRREACAIALLDHPGIVRVLGEGASGTGPFLVMEHVEGLTVATVLDRIRRAGARPECLAARHFAVAAGLRDPDTRSWAACVAGVVRDVAAALAHAHSRGVVHRDVKPSNVMVRASDGRPMLLDFGLAAIAGAVRVTMPGDFVGTVRYASPEQADGRALDADGRSDVWSLGAALYEMLTLRPPFASADAAELLRSIRAGDAPAIRSLNPAVPEGLVAVCRRALEPDLGRRCPSAARFAEDLAQWSDRA